MKIKQCLDIIDDWCWENLPTYCTLITNFGYFIKHLPYVLKANIDWLIFFNKNKCYFNWDFEFMLDLLEHKLKLMRKYFLKANIAKSEEYELILEGIEKTLQHINNYKNADEVYERLHGEFPAKLEWIMEEQSNKSFTISCKDKKLEQQFADYILAKYEFEQKEWENIWDTLKECAQKWWD